MPQDDFDNWRMNADKLDEYVAKVRKVQKDFPQLTIRLALEVDYLPGYEDWIRDLAARHPWDYFIGSVHYVSDSWAIDDPQKLSEWKHRDADEVWTVYFERLTQGGRNRLLRNHRPRRFAEEIRASSAAMIARRFTKISGRRQETRLCHRTQHRRLAEGLPGNLSQPRNPPARVSNRRAHHLRLRRPCAGGSGNEFCRSRPTGAGSRLSGMLPVCPTPETDSRSFDAMPQAESNQHSRRRLICLLLI